MKDIKNLKKNQLIVKSNWLVEARYKLTIQEQRLVLLMISMIKKGDKDFQPYRIKVSEFMKIVGKKGQSDYHDMKKLTRRLLERVIVIKERDGERQTHWVSVAKYYDRKGYVDLHFDPRLKDLLLDIKEYFTHYKLEDVIRLKSYYSIRIYELLKQYVKKIKIRTFDLNELREILGIKKNQYKLYGHFKNKVILPAQEELTQKCDITFQLKEIKKGRKVVGLEFIIIPNKKDKECLELISKVGETEHESLYEKLQKYFCFTAITAQEVIDKYSPERIIKNLAYVEEKNNTGKVRDIGAYTLKAIKENYTLIRSQFDIDKEEKERAKKAKEEQEWRERELERKYNIYRNQEIEKHKKGLPKEDIELIEKGITAEQAKKQKNKKFQEIFARRELEKHFAKEAKIPKFEQWKKEQLEELKN